MAENKKFALSKLTSLSMNSTHVLHNGIQMPVFGFGTYELTGAALTKSLEHALDAGYRHIDTAKFYQNETEIGKTIKNYLQSHSNVKRDDLFIVSKLWYTDQGYDSAIEAFNKSLSKLQLDYLDLYLIHWPGSNLSNKDPKNAQLRAESWKALEKLYMDGKIKAIGVSNYTVDHLQQLNKECQIQPMVNQVEFHPYLYQKELLEYCHNHDIVLEAYSSLAKGELVREKTVNEIAKAYKKTSAQILLRWPLQHGVVVIPKATSKERIVENAEIFDFEISAEDMKKLDGLNKNYHCTWNPYNVV